MRKTITTSLITISLGLFAQENQEIVYQEGGERNPTLEEQGKVKANTYKTYKKAKAWNQRSSNILTGVSELGPNKLGGRVRGLLVDKDNNIALAAPSGGGLWTFNPTNGDPFTPLDDIGSFLPITHIAQNPLNKSTIYLSTGDGLHGTVGNGIFKSTDKGVSFNLISSTDPMVNSDFEYCQLIKCSPQNANELYVAAERKLLKSTDGGSTWTTVFQGSRSYNKIHSIDFLSGGGVIIGVDYSGAHYSSTGNNGSFTLSTSGIWNTPTNTTSEYNGVVVATQGGHSNICFAAVASFSEMRVYKSTNGGLNWTEVTNPGFTSNQPTFSMMVGVHPNDPNKVIVGSTSYAFTENGGATWQRGCGLEVDYHTCHFHDSDPDVAYIGYDQGFGSVDFNNPTSTSRCPDLQPKSFELGKQGEFNTLQIYYGDFYPTGDNILVGHQDGGCMSKKDGISRRVKIGDGGTVFVNKQNPNNVFTSTQYGNLAKSTSGNNPTYGSFSPIGNYSRNNYPHFITQFAGNDADGDQLYIASSTSIDRSTDGGNSFNTIMPTTLFATKVAVSNEVNPIVYAYGFRRTGDRGSDIIRIENANTANSGTVISNIIDYSNDGWADEIKIDPNNHNTVFITTMEGNAYRLSNLDGAYTKTDIKGDLGDVQVNMIIGVFGKPDFLFAATNIGLFYSSNGGTNWVLSNSIPHTRIDDLRYRSSDNRLFVFTHGRGAFAATFDITVSTRAEINNLANIYPNPCDVNFQIEHPNLNQSQITIYNINGDLVHQEKVNSNKATINTANLARGNYVLHITSKGQLISINKFTKK